MRRPRDLHELVGEEFEAGERARLEHVHELLVHAGPLPDLPPSLAKPHGERSRTVSLLPRRRLAFALGLAAAIAVALLGGYLAGRDQHGFVAAFNIQMHATGAAPRALAVVHVGRLDSAGNRPIEVEVRNLTPLPGGRIYEMYLTRNHRRSVSCGTFRVAGSTTSVRLNAPYNLRRFDGWIVTEHVPGGREQTVLTA